MSEAKAFCHMVRDCDLMWFEERSRPTTRRLAEVRRSTHVPIATGESEFTRFDLRAPGLGITVREELVERHAKT